MYSTFIALSTSLIWTGEAVGQINDVLSAMKVDLIGDGIKARYVPDGAILEECYSLGELMASRLDEMCSK